MVCFCIWGPLKSHGRGFRLNWSFFVFMAHAPSGPAFQHIQSVVWTNIFPEIKLCSKTPGWLIFTNLNNFYAHYQFTLPFFPCHVWSYELCVFCFSSLPFVLLWKHWRFLSPQGFLPFYCPFDLLGFSMKMLCHCCFISLSFLEKMVMCFWACDFIIVQYKFGVRPCELFVPASVRELCHFMMFDTMWYKVIYNVTGGWWL